MATHFFGGDFFGGEFFSSVVKARGKGRVRLPVIRYVVELGEDKHYFKTEAAALAFIGKRAEVLYKRARSQVISRTHRIELPKGTAISLPKVLPIPRFVVQGSAAISALSHRINAVIDAILSDPEYEARQDDDDLARLL